MKKVGAPVKVLIEDITTSGAPADDQGKIHAATEPARCRTGSSSLQTRAHHHVHIAGESPSSDTEGSPRRPKTPTSARSVCSDTAARLSEDVQTLPGGSGQPRSECETERTGGAGVGTGTISQIGQRPADGSGL